MPRRNGLEPGFRQHWNLHKTGKGRSEWSLIFFLGPPKGSHAGVRREAGSPKPGEFPPRKVARGRQAGCQGCLWAGHSAKQKEVTPPACNRVPHLVAQGQALSQS